MTGGGGIRLAVAAVMGEPVRLQAAGRSVQALATKKPADLQVKHWAEYE